MNIAALGPGDRDALLEFFGQLSEWDLILIKVGRALACRVLAEAVRAGRRKVVVEVAADQEHALAMFGPLGFTGEALLRDHIRDGSGQLHDLVMLAHHVDGTSSRMETADVTKELGSEDSAR